MARKRPPDGNEYWPEQDFGDGTREEGGEFGGTLGVGEWQRRSSDLPHEARFINPTDTPFSSQQQRIPGGDIKTDQETRIRKL